MNAKLMKKKRTKIVQKYVVQLFSSSGDKILVSLEVSEKSEWISPIALS